MSTIKFSATNLAKPIKVGNVELKNRLVNTSSARLRAAMNGNPTDIMLQYFADRAEDNGGLLLGDSCSVTDKFGRLGFGSAIITDEQAKKWKLVTDAVHAKGSHFALQLYAMDKRLNAYFKATSGFPPVGTNGEYDDPSNQDLSLEEVEMLKKDIISAGKRAVEIAGVDYVEIHAGFGFIYNEAALDGEKARNDKYGGSIENRSRLLLEIVDELSAIVGAEKVGIRIGPYMALSATTQPLTHPITQYSYLLQELEKRGQDGKRIAYVSFVEPVMRGADVIEKFKDLHPTWMEEIWSGVIIRTGNYTKELEKMKSVVNADDRTLIGACRHFTSNPDLFARLSQGLELTPYDRSKFYVPLSNDGFNTFVRYGEKPIPEDSELRQKVGVSL